MLVDCQPVWLEEPTMSIPNRRIFIFRAAAAGAALASVRVPAQTPAVARLEETDPQAVALGYRHDTRRVDKTKFPKHDLTQVCDNCQLYQGQAQDVWGPCALFAGKQVAAKGWCSAWVKKAA
jgi:hypothetical protein